MKLHKSKMYQCKISQRLHIPTLFSLLCVATFSYAQKAAASDSAAVFRLYELVIHRLELMPQVAAAKKISGLPVTDTVREREVIEKFRAAALTKGLEPEAAASFMQWQIQLASKMQRQLIEKWRNGIPDFPGAGKTLAQLRVELDLIGQQMIDQLVLCASSFARGNFINPSPLLKSKLKILVTDRNERRSFNRILRKQRIMVTKTTDTNKK